jgi:tRNA pseudouridine38-40 synthase
MLSISHGRVQTGALRRSSTLLRTGSNRLKPLKESAQFELEPHRGASNWKVTLAYDGTDYHGWQVQPGYATVQGELQAALRRVTGESPLPQGSGRTDAGVHALAQVASFMLQAAIPAENLSRALNRTLPAAIRVLGALTVPNSFHARHSTVAKTYEYRVFLEKLSNGAIRTDAETLCPPFLARYVYAYPWPLQFPSLERAAEAFVGTHDFLSFSATDPDEAARESGADDENAEPRTAVRTIYSSSWQEDTLDEGALFIYRVRGSGFLHHMVRNLVGTMLDVGRGHRIANEIPAMIAARSRSAAGPTAPARGLFLHSVEYPE